MRGFGRGKGPDTGSRIRRALIAVLDSDRDTAVDELREIVRADSDDFQAYLALAHLYRERGEVGRALRIHQNLLMRGELPAGLRLRAQAALAEDLRAGGHRDRAIAAYQEVLAHDPRNESAKLAMIELWVESGQHALALEQVEGRGLFRRGGDAERGAQLLRAMALAERERGQDVAARKLLRRALKRDPGAAETHIALGDLEAERGRDKAALAVWGQAIALELDDPDALWQRIASACTAIGKPAELDKLVRSRLEQQPGDVAARRALARLLTGRGDADAALTELRRALDVAPGDLRTRVQIGRLLLGEQRETDAAKELGELLSVLADSGLAALPMRPDESADSERRDSAERAAEPGPAAGAPAISTQASANAADSEASEGAEPSSGGGAGADRRETAE